MRGKVALLPTDEQTALKYDSVARYATIEHLHSEIEVNAKLEADWQAYNAIIYDAGECSGTNGPMPAYTKASLLWNTIRNPAQQGNMVIATGGWDDPTLEFTFTGSLVRHVLALGFVI